MSPAEHPATFSHINTRILVAGLMFISTVLCAAPLYGWGEYSNYKGVVEILIEVTGVSESNMTRENTATNHGNRSVSTLSTDTERLYVDVRNESIILTHDLCKPMTASPHETIAKVLVDVFEAFFQDNFDIYVRKVNFFCEERKSLVTLRVNNLEAITEISRLYNHDLMSSSVERFVSHKIQQQGLPIHRIFIQTSLDMEAVAKVLDVYLPFQGIGVCTFDFTTVYMMSSIVYMLVTTTLIPYLIILTSGISLCVRHYWRQSEGTAADYLYVRILYVCGFSSIVFCIPYYLTNFLNAKGRIISTGCNFFSTLLFYFTPLCVSVPYMAYRMNEYNLKTRIKSFTSKSYLLQNKGNRYSSSLSIQTEKPDAQV